MFRGCQKKIIMLKNTGSDMFDEAYFIIKESAAANNVSEGDMISEANRIISDNQLSSYCAKRMRGGIFSHGRWKYCLCGAGGCGAVIGLLMWLSNLC